MPSTLEIQLPDGSVRQRAVRPESIDDLAIRLVQSTNAYEAAVGQLAHDKRNVEIREQDREAALNDTSQSDEDILLKATAYNKSKKWCEQQEAKVSRDAAELESTFLGFHAALNAYQISEMDRVRALKRAAVIHAAQFIGDHNSHPLIRNSVEVVLRFSEPVMAIGALRPPDLSPIPGQPGYWVRGDMTCVLRLSSLLLEQFRRLQDLKEKI